MRLAVLFSLIAVVSCSREEPATNPPPTRANPDVESLESGQHDLVLLGTWKGIASPEIRLVFVGDGSLEIQLHEQTWNKGHWRSESGKLFFLALMQDDPELSIQSCAYSVDAKGRLKLVPEPFASSNSLGYRKIEAPELSGRVYDHEGKDWRPVFVSEKTKEVEFVDAWGSKSSMTGHDMDDGDGWAVVTYECVLVGFGDGTRDTLWNGAIVFSTSSGQVAAIER